MDDIFAFEPIWPGWKIGKQLGKGSFGAVYRATRNDELTGIVQEAAVKHISIPSGSNDDDSTFDPSTLKAYYDSQLQSLVREINAMVELRGKPNIVAYEEHRIIPKESGLGYDLFLRMELLEGLTGYVKQRGGLPVRDPKGGPSVVKLGIDVARAL